jgi:hypothetical protein
MWTRYNIAQPTVEKMIGHFKEDWEITDNAIKKLPVTDLANQLGWTDIQDRFDAAHNTVAGWVEKFESWVGSCYPAPTDRTIKTSDQICLYGIDYKTIQEGERAADAMWNDFFRPLIESYKDHPEYNEDLFDEIFAEVFESVWAVGKRHSFRCEFIFIRTRVRYFEIIPTWEI